MIRRDLFARAFQTPKFVPSSQRHFSLERQKISCHLFVHLLSTADAVGQLPSSSGTLKRFIKSRPSMRSCSLIPPTSRRVGVQLKGHAQQPFCKTALIMRKLARVLSRTGLNWRPHSHQLWSLRFYSSAFCFLPFSCLRFEEAAFKVFLMGFIFRRSRP